MPECFEIGTQPPGYVRVDPDTEYPDEAGCEAACGDPDAWEVGCCYWQELTSCTPSPCPPCGDECYVGELNVPHLVCFGSNSGDDNSSCDKVVDWCTETIYNVCNDLVYETASMGGCNWSGDRSPCNNPDLPDWWKPSGGARKTPARTGFTTRRLTKAEVAAMSKDNPLP
jgi:hypothetical protein